MRKDLICDFKRPRINNRFWVSGYPVNRSKGQESAVYCEVHPFNKIDAKIISDFAPRAVILSGGPASVLDTDTPRAPDELFELDIPVLGICYGQQTMVEQLGGKVQASEHREFGRAFIKVTDKCALFDDVWSQGAEEEVWMSHGDRVDVLPRGFKVVGVK